MPRNLTIYCQDQDSLDNQHYNQRMINTTKNNTTTNKSRSPYYKTNKSFVFPVSMNTEYNTYCQTPQQKESSKSPYCFKSPKYTRIIEKTLLQRLSYYDQQTRQKKIENQTEFKIKQEQFCSLELREKPEINQISKGLYEKVKKQRKLSPNILERFQAYQCERVSRAAKYQLLKTYGMKIKANTPTCRVITRQKSRSCLKQKNCNRQSNKSRSGDKSKSNSKIKNNNLQRPTTALEISKSKKYLTTYQPQNYPPLSPNNKVTNIGKIIKTSTQSSILSQNNKTKRNENHNNKYLYPHTYQNYDHHYEEPTQSYKIFINSKDSKQDHRAFEKKNFQRNPSYSMLSPSSSAYKFSKKNLRQDQWQSGNNLNGYKTNQKFLNTFQSQQNQQQHDIQESKQSFYPLKQKSSQFLQKANQTTSNFTKNHKTFNQKDNHKQFYRSDPNNNNIKKIINNQKNNKQQVLSPFYYQNHKTFNTNKKWKVVA